MQSALLSGFAPTGSDASEGTRCRSAFEVASTVASPDFAGSLKLASRPYLAEGGPYVNLAAEMLANGADTVLSVALAVGYEDPSNFARAFRQVTGVSPGQYAQAVVASP